MLEIIGYCNSCFEYKPLNGNHLCSICERIEERLDKERAKKRNTYRRAHLKSRWRQRYA